MKQGIDNQPVGKVQWVDRNSLNANDYNPNFVCAQPFQRMFIMYDGRVTPCCLDAKRDYVLGDVNNSSVKEIWHGERLTEMRNLHIKGKYRDIDICRKCSIPINDNEGKATPEIV